MVKKVANINAIRAQKVLVLLRKVRLHYPYSFDYLLLCNKICGASHYNMQMKIIVDTPEDYKIWLKEQTKLAEQVKAANALQMRMVRQ
jgi:cytochrome c oxidase subunit 2